MTTLSTRIRPARDLGADSAARALARRRVALGIPLEAFAQRVGISQGTLYRLESTGRVAAWIRDLVAQTLTTLEAESVGRHLLLARTVDDVRYTLREQGCAWWTERGRSVRVAVVHCEDAFRQGPGCAWSHTVRVEDGVAVPSGASPCAKLLPAEIEHAVVAVLMSARRAA